MTSALRLLTFCVDTGGGLKLLLQWYVIIVWPVPAPLLALGESIHWWKHSQEVPDLRRQWLPGSRRAGGLHRQGDYPWLPGRRVYGEWRFKIWYNHCECDGTPNKLRSPLLTQCFLSSAKYQRVAWFPNLCTAPPRSLRTKMSVYGPRRSTKVPASSRERHMRWDWTESATAGQSDK